MSRILVDQIRSNSASADAITLDGSGNLTIPGNATISGTATGFGGGKVLQVVYGTTSSSAFNYTSTLADTNLTATITPSATTSKILVIVSQAWSSRKTNAGYSGGFIGIFRGSTQITANTGTSMYDMYISAGGATSNERYDRLTLVQLDEPSQLLQQHIKLNKPLLKLLVEVLS